VAKNTRLLLGGMEIADRRGNLPRQWRTASRRPADIPFTQAIKPKSDVASPASNVVFRKNAQVLSRTKCDFADYIDRDGQERWEI
jgi:hypothetical protein